MANNQIKVLNDLISTCHDAEEGYAKAAKGVHNTRISDLLTGLSGERERFASELFEVVKQLGGEPAHDAHLGGILHQGWVDLETRIRSKGEIELIRECMLGEQETIQHYQHALGTDLSAEARAIVERQLNAVQNDLQRLQDLSQKGVSQHA